MSRIIAILLAISLIIICASFASAAAGDTADIAAAVRFLNVQKCMYGQDSNRFYTVCPAATAVAQAWADTMASNKDLSHSGTSYNQKVCGTTGLGENIYKSSSSTATYLNSMSSFFSEAPYYDYQAQNGNCVSTKPISMSSCGHFSSLIWASATVIGFGRAVNDGTYIAVDPGTLSANGKAPNMDGYFSTNVNPLSTDPSRSQANCEATVDAWTANQGSTATYTIGNVYLASSASSTTAVTALEKGNTSTLYVKWSYTGNTASTITVTYYPTAATTNPITIASNLASSVTSASWAIPSSLLATNGGRIVVSSNQSTNSQSSVITVTEYQYVTGAANPCVATDPTACGATVAGTQTYAYTCASRTSSTGSFSGSVALAKCTSYSTNSIPAATSCTLNIECDSTDQTYTINAVNIFERSTTTKIQSRLDPGTPVTISWTYSGSATTGFSFEIYYINGNDEVLITTVDSSKTSYDYNISATAAATTSARIAVRVSSGRASSESQTFGVYQYTYVATNKFNTCEPKADKTCGEGTGTQISITACSRTDGKSTTTDEISLDKCESFAANTIDSVQTTRDCDVCSSSNNAMGIFAMSNIAVVAIATAVVIF